MESAFRSIWTRFLVTLVVLGLSAVTSAQVSKGSISGTIIDATGAAVPGAEVRATSTDTNQVSSTVSDNSGLFKLPLLSVGNYRVDVSKTGFRKSSLAAV